MLLKYYKIIILIILFSHPCVGQNKIHIITIDGVINPASQEFIQKSIERAEDDKASVLLLKIDTPGGLLKSTRLIVKDMMASHVPIIVFIAPSGSRAGSAGVFITIAAHIAGMAPGTNIGAASVVTMGGGGSDSTMMKKVTNDAVAFIKSIAEKRNRNAEWAEKAVREAASITETEALKLGVIDFIAPDIDSLLMLSNGKEVETRSGKVVLQTSNLTKTFINMPLRLKILDIISNPNIAYILFLIGIYGILFELYNPGAIFPGAVGAISLILAFYALQTLPVNYAGLLLMLLAVIFFIMEIKITSYGLLSIGGVVSLVLGSVMLFDSPLPFLRVSWEVIAAATITTLLFFVFAVGLGIRAQRRKPVTGQEGLIDEIGEAMENFKIRNGNILVHGEIWKASSNDKIKKGDLVKIVKIEGLNIFVEKST